MEPRELPTTATSVPRVAHLLIVDDEASTRETIELMLGADPYGIRQAANGAEALDQLRQGATDLIISDAIMPGMDGFELSRRVKADARTRFIPIILLTGLEGDDDLVRGIEAGADQFLRKPVTRVQLRAAVRAMLRVRAQYTHLNAHDGPKEQLGARLASAGLSDREREVLDLILLGRTHEDVATVLNISPRTSKFHQTNVLKKLGAESRLDLLRILL